MYIYFTKYIYIYISEGYAALHQHCTDQDRDANFNQVSGGPGPITRHHILPSYIDTSFHRPDILIRLYGNGISYTRHFIKIA